MLARLSAFVIWALVAATAVFWGLRLLVRAPAAPAAPEGASRFRLLGIVAPIDAQAGGVALIAVDGKMPKAFAVGAPLDGDLVLKSVSLRTASIASGQGGPTIT